MRCHAWPLIVGAGLVLSLCLVGCGTKTKDSESVLGSATCSTPSAQATVRSPPPDVVAMKQLTVTNKGGSITITWIAAGTVEPPTAEGELVAYDAAFSQSRSALRVVLKAPPVLSFAVDDSGLGGSSSGWTDSAETSTKDSDKALFSGKPTVAGHSVIATFPSSTLRGIHAPLYWYGSEFVTASVTESHAGSLYQTCPSPSKGFTQVAADWTNSDFLTFPSTKGLRTKKLPTPSPSSPPSVTPTSTATFATTTTTPATSSTTPPSYVASGPPGADKDASEACQALNAAIAQEVSADPNAAATTAPIPLSSLEMWARLANAAAQSDPSYEPLAISFQAIVNYKKGGSDSLGAVGSACAQVP